MRLKNIRTGKYVGPENAEIDDFLKLARGLENKLDLHYHRRRIGYDKYVIEVWSFNPLTEKLRAKHLFDIEDVDRKALKRRGKMVDGPPTARPSLKPRGPLPNP